jgi:scyllo-inositol 2-dehydrogenase (NADP+)
VGIGSEAGHRGEGRRTVPATEEIRVALIGFGLGGAVFHAPLIVGTPGMRLVSIVTGDAERQARARERYPEARILSGAGDLWAASGAHDLVVISTHNSSHVPLALSAIEAELAVVVDKPLAASSADAERLVEAARRRGALLTVFQNRRWDGDFLTLRHLLAEGAIGRPLRFESRFERWRPERDRDAWRERGAPEEAGGLLFDLGSHLIDQAVLLFGPPTHVYAELERRRPGAEVDDDAFVALAHPGGVRSHLWMSAVAGILGLRMRLLGDHGAFEKDGLDVQEDALAAGGQLGSPDWGREPSERWGTLATDEGARTVETAPGDYGAFYAGVADALHTQAPPPVDAVDAVVGLRIIEAAQRSAENRTVEEFPG